MGYKTVQHLCPCPEKILSNDQAKLMFLKDKCGLACMQSVQQPLNLSDGEKLTLTKMTI